MTQRAYGLCMPLTSHEVFWYAMTTLMENQEPVTGVVSETLPNAMFRVRLEGGEGKEILTYLAGKMRVHKIRILVGDRVSVVLDPYGERGRVVRRL